MMKRILTDFFFAVAAVAFISSCANENKSGSTDTFTSGSIQFAADESFSPIIEEVRELFEYKYPDAKLTPIYTNESEAVDLLMKDSLWLIITSRDYKPAELENLKARKQFPLSIRMAYDGLALVQNAQNTDSCISVKDIRRILTGEVKRWEEIYPGSKLGDIEIVFDNKKSSTVHYVEDSILGGKPITAPSAFAVDSTAEVVEYVEQHKSAIGLIGSNWLNDKRDSTNLTFKRGIRPMAVSTLDVANDQNSYKPYQYYFYNGSYPFTRTLYILLNDTNSHGLPTGFKNFIISQNEGQMVILKAGLLPAYGNITFRSVHVNDE